MWVILLQKFKLNKKGASLIEIIATITIVSIALLMIYSILANNIRQNGVNQEKSVNANVANSALSYTKGLDFKIISKYYSDYAVDNRAVINVDNCRILSQDNENFNEDLCKSVLYPLINNKQFNASNLNIYLTPSNSSENIIQVTVIVNSSINERHDFSLEGVITND